MLTRPWSHTAATPQPCRDGAGEVLDGEVDAVLAEHSDLDHPETRPPPGSSAHFRSHPLEQTDDATGPVVQDVVAGVPRMYDETGVFSGAGGGDGQR
jgi:hypothetical protein